MINTVRITLASFLAYFVMSGMLAPIGIVSGPMAEAFDVSVLEITELFSWLTGGIWVGALIALVIFRWATLRLVFLGVYILIALALTSFALHAQLPLVGLALGLIGVSCGIGLPAAAVVISKTYSLEQRASMLVMTDGAFSVAGIVCAAVAVRTLAQGMPWYSAYLFVAGIAGLIVVGALCSRFPEADEDQVEEPSINQWPVTAWICIVALALYTLAQNTLLWWLPQFAQTVRGLDPADAGALVGQFWTGMFIAQIVVAVVVFKLGVSRLLWMGALGTTLFSIPIWMMTSAEWLAPLALAWGFANLGLLKLVLSFASQFTPIASARLVSSLLFGATTGTAISPWVSSQVVRLGDVNNAMLFGSGVYALMFSLLLAVLLIDRKRVENSM